MHTHKQLHTLIHPPTHWHDNENTCNNRGDYDNNTDKHNDNDNNDIYNSNISINNTE